MTRFTLPYPRSNKQKAAWAKRYGLNAYWAGKHWSARRADAEYWHTLVRAELTRQQIPKRLYTVPVKATFCWNDRLDVDNHAAIGKMIIDALKGWLLQNDNRRWYAACEHKYHEGDHILVEIEEV